MKDDKKIKNKFVCPANRDDSAPKRRSAPSLFVCLRTGSSQEVSFCTCEFRRRSRERLAEKVVTLGEIIDVGINFNIATVIDSLMRGVHFLKEDIWSDVLRFLDLAPLSTEHDVQSSLPLPILHRSGGTASGYQRLDSTTNPYIIPYHPH